MNGGAPNGALSGRPAAPDALLVVSFGGPEGPDDVRPFLESVVRGRGVPPARVAEAARHYDLFGGISPINARNRELVAALRVRLEREPFRLPVYWGNRHSRPTLTDAVEEMRRAGVTNALAFVTSAFESPAGFSRYVEALGRASAEVGAGAASITALPAFSRHPLFLAAQADVLREALAQAGPGRTRIVFTAHSIPTAMAQGCAYERELREACSSVARAAGVDDWLLAYQSRSGRPEQPWLGPDVRAGLVRAAAVGAAAVIACPIGFVSDHMEVCYDLDVEARAEAESLGLRFIRCRTVGDHPAFVEMIVDMVTQSTPVGSRHEVSGRQEGSVAVGR